MARGTTTERGAADGPAGPDGPATPDANGQERNPFRKVWWLPVVRGTLLVVLGLLLMIEPLEQLGTLRVVLGAFLVADGVLVAVQGFVHRKQVGSAWWLAQAGVNVVFGVVVALWPDLTATALYYVLAVWVLVLGITTIAGAAALVRNRDLGWAWMLAVGIVSVLFGVLLVTRPLDSFDVLRLVAVVFALYAFVTGAIHVVSGFAVRAVARELADLRAQAVAAGVVVTGGSVLGAPAAHPGVAPPSAVGAASAGSPAAPGPAAPDEPAPVEPAPVEPAPDPASRAPSPDAPSPGGPGADEVEGRGRL
ncbi:HdeD family acid-resistance protein [Cellulosimicrobium sp. NPDC057862]|uniref:HdeD family acid-resistance protein n=1 Tax=Cellulosimicrobium sp. NPDC057862 TaxID=3346266 RepID=UPI00366FD267